MRWLVSWSLYWLGDAVSRPMEAFDWGWLYPVYNWLMLRSGDVQGEGPGPWQTDDEYEALKDQW